MTDLSMDKIVDKVTISLSIDDLRCPITHEIMNEPYTATDGHIYERQAIEDWFTTVLDGESMHLMSKFKYILPKTI